MQGQAVAAAAPLRAHGRPPRRRTTQRRSNLTAVRLSHNPRQLRDRFTPAGPRGRPPQLRSGRGRGRHGLRTADARRAPHLRCALGCPPQRRHGHRLGLEQGLEPRIGPGTAAETGHLALPSFRKDRIPGSPGLGAAAQLLRLRGWPGSGAGGWGKGAGGLGAGLRSARAAVEGGGLPSRRVCGNEHACFYACGGRVPECFSRTLSF